MGVWVYLSEGLKVGAVGGGIMKVEMFGLFVGLTVGLVDGTAVGDRIGVLVTDNVAGALVVDGSTGAAVSGGKVRRAGWGQGWCKGGGCRWCWGRRDHHDYPHHRRQN